MDEERRRLAHVTQTIYDQLHLPSAAELQAMTVFDELCFSGSGKTTSDKYAPPTLSADEIKDGIEKYRNVYVVERDPEGAIVSCMSYFVRGKQNQEKDLHIMSIAVHPNFRGLHIADRLLTELYEAGAKLGIQKFTLRVDPLNTPALCFYLTRGYLILGGRTANIDDEHPNVVTLAATHKRDCNPDFDSSVPPLIVIVDDFVKVQELALQGYAGVSVDNGMLTMKRMTEEARMKFVPWS